MAYTRFFSSRLFKKKKYMLLQPVRFFPLGSLGHSGSLFVLLVVVCDNHEIVACLGQQQPNKSSACSV